MTINYTEIELFYTSNGMIGPGHSGRRVVVLRCSHCAALIYQGDENLHTLYHRVEAEEE